MASCEAGVPKIPRKLRRGCALFVHSCVKAGDDSKHSQAQGRGGNQSKTHTEGNPAQENGEPWARGAPPGAGKSWADSLQVWPAGAAGEEPRTRVIMAPESG